MYFRHCKFRRQNKFYTAWIPEVRIKKKIGQYFRLMLDDGWQDGWMLTSYSDTRLDTKKLQLHNKPYNKFIY